MAGTPTSWPARSAAGCERLLHINLPHPGRGGSDDRVGRQPAPAVAPRGAPFIRARSGAGRGGAVARPRTRFWTPESYDRLRRVKAAVDPGDLIHSNHPVPPHQDTEKGHRQETQRRADEAVAG